VTKDRRLQDVENAIMRGTAKLQAALIALYAYEAVNREEARDLLARLLRITDRMVLASGQQQPLTDDWIARQIDGIDVHAAHFRAKPKPA
jgi:hypothetical protein